MKKNLAIWIVILLSFFGSLPAAAERILIRETQQSTSIKIFTDKGDFVGDMLLDKGLHASDLSDDEIIKLFNHGIIARSSYTNIVRLVWDADWWLPLKDVTITSNKYFQKQPNSLLVSLIRTDKQETEPQPALWTTAFFFGFPLAWSLFSTMVILAFLSLCEMKEYIKTETIAEVNQPLRFSSLIKESFAEILNKKALPVTIGYFMGSIFILLATLITCPEATMLTVPSAILVNLTMYVCMFYCSKKIKKFRINKYPTTAKA